MSAAIVGDVIPLNVAERQPPPNNKMKADEIMANIQSEDHKRLAAVLSTRVDGLEEKVDGLGTKVDNLSAAVNQTVGKLSVLVPDDDAPAGKRTLLDILYKHPWLLPVTLVVGAIAFGSTAFLEYLHATP